MGIQILELGKQLVTKETSAYYNKEIHIANKILGPLY